MASSLFATTAMAAALLAGQAAAQEDGAQPLTLDPLVVEGQGATATGPVQGYVATQSATGAKTGTPINEIPQSLTVIGREQLDDRQVRKVDEALRYVAGVTAQPFGHDADTDWFYIRGFDAGQTGVFMDGLPLYQYGFGAFAIDPFTLERIEVLRGSASALYGGSSTGGIVNFVSKRPTGERIRYVEAGIDNWGTAFTGFDIGDSVDPEGEWSYRLVGRIAGGDTQTEHADGFRGVIAPSLLWRPNEDTSLTLLASYQRMDMMHGTGFLPYVGTVVDAPYGRIDRDFFYGEPDIDSLERDQTMVGYEFEHEFDSGWTFRQNARYANVEAEELGPYPIGYVDETTGLLSRINFGHDTSVNTASIDNQAEVSFATGALDHTLLTGVDYRYYNIDHVQAVGPATPINVNDPVYGLPQAPLGAPYLDQDLTMNQLGFYAQDQVRFGEGWIATFNGRYDRLWTESEGSAEFDAETGELSGRFGLAYEFQNGLTPYVSVARSFDPEIGSGADGTPFEPTIGVQYEAGLKYSPTFADATITAAVFELTRQNVLVDDPDDPLFAQAQLGEVRSRGVEIEGAADITENTRLIAAFTAYDLEITKDTDPTLVGKRPTLMPEVMASLWVDHRFSEGMLEGFSIGGGSRMAGSSFADTTNTLEVPGYVVFDAAIRYEVGNWGLALNVTNLFDEDYVAGCNGENVCNYGQARTAVVSASYTW
ncbi:TonB-dependent siderophore receptor [Inquilinus sp. CAU 1745]|uniref:TonB-dependent siderophore receptor n=1 Tax=Inquilinus sp. CAU 1745 TaxID=3140369 RepID=UPI00325AFE9F